MTVHSPATPPATAPRRRSHPVTATVMVVVGLVAALLGGMILFGGDDQSIGLGGDASWRVGEIDPAWGYWLVIGAAATLAAAAALILRDRRRAAATAEPHGPWSDVLAHGGVFVIVNGFLWAQDIAIGDGVNYAFWVTIPWGLGLLAHVVATAADERRGPPAHRDLPHG